MGSDGWRRTNLPVVAVTVQGPMGSTGGASAAEASQPAGAVWALAGAMALASVPRSPSARALGLDPRSARDCSSGSTR